MKSNPQVETLFEQLVEGVQRFYSSDTWKAFLTFQSKFYTYSFSNVVLIWMQCPHASHVAGFTKWKEMNRRVKKGEKAIRILAPLMAKQKDKETGEEKKVIIGFWAVSVFDVSQTEGAPLPQLCSELTGNNDTLAAFYQALKSIIDIPVKEEDIAGGAKGYYHIKEEYIAVKKDLDLQNKCKTLIHEYPIRCCIAKTMTAGTS
ncbi:ArdC family protein [Aneurinibacillus aneurinilyticus]|uniref:N-terminal domain-containing protein n=1 Tax=Aneurinibacillus aneurinilyticus TaxID=1391 RepID=A0A848D1M3_ANEAE|nr:ArdC family protein [Aneurinibacillus aneurinilyticus]NMF01142.1 hypothetical protein [Aneurinibacillus aneurinilyticus]